MGVRFSRQRQSRYLDMPAHNTFVEFLIILSKEDIYYNFLACLKLNRKKRFMSLSKHMNGILNIAQNGATTCDCCDKPFSIRDVSALHVLYAKLPKEGIYITVDSWQHEYFKSQMMELLYILRRLGARSVNLTLEKKHNTQFEVGSSVNSWITPLIQAETGMKVSTMTSAENSVHIEADYDQLEPSLVYNDSLSFTKDTNIYYLTQRQDWQDIIIQRSLLGLKDIKFNFTITNGLSIDKDFFTKIKDFGIKVADKDIDNSSFSISGRVSF